MKFIRAYAHREPFQRNTSMSKFMFHELFPLKATEPEFRLLTTDHLEIINFNGTDVLTVDSEGLIKLA